MLDQDLILILVVLFFVLGCSFKCNGIKENFACKDKQCAEILEMEGGDKKAACKYKKDNKPICNTCDFCTENFTNDNFTMGNDHRSLRKSAYNCSECETECNAKHCKENVSWCSEHLGIETNNHCSKLKEGFSDAYQICDICKNNCQSTNCAQHQDWCEKQGKPFNKNCAKSKYD